ncbi:hypothetical protein ASD11_17425 [Aeromicrobium sp. Root495]|uniref:GAF domain-containing protein n=1 Tax=Aeromicrobium sp. Root495 TaxID=1736550 RepID=UPI0006F8EA92|nr:GAF domain-containing protein [Aeromicrobium sp. Root495]KQY55324.1 hypothetical protein ASD11_17425 [Aeromicrobium sp. Root495]
MKPIEETQQVLDDLATYGDEGTLAQLSEMSDLIRQIVPECVGLSVCMVDTGITFTLVATDEEIAALDAVQYLDGGPCLDAVETRQIITAPAGDALALDEDIWLMHAQATAAVGIRSTMSIPLNEDDEVVGGINLYASTPHAFDEQVEVLARALGSSAAEAVRNADLTFGTREQARLGPTHLDEYDQVNRAVGALVHARGIESGSARKVLRDAAARAGLSEGQVARAVLGLLAD